MKKLIKKWLGIYDYLASFRSMAEALIAKEIKEEMNARKTVDIELERMIKETAGKIDQIAFVVKGDISNYEIMFAESRKDMLDKISRLEKGIFDAVSEIERLSKDNAILKGFREHMLDELDNIGRCLAESTSQIERLSKDIEKLNSEESKGSVFSDIVKKYKCKWESHQ